MISVFVFSSSSSVGSKLAFMRFLRLLILFEVVRPPPPEAAADFESLCGVNVASGLACYCCGARRPGFSGLSSTIAAAASGDETDEYILAAGMAVTMTSDSLLL